VYGYATLDIRLTKFPSSPLAGDVGSKGPYVVGLRLSVISQSSIKAAKLRIMQITLTTA